jgi:hypothetical protein
MSACHSPAPAALSKLWFTAGVCPLGSKCAHLRKSSFLVAPMVVNFITKRNVVIPVKYTD